MQQMKLNYYRLLQNGRAQDLRYQHTRGDKVRINSGRYTRHIGTIESRVFDKSVDYKDESAPGYHVVLADGHIVIVRWDQVILLPSQTLNG